MSISVHGFVNKQSSIQSKVIVYQIRGEMSYILNAYIEKCSAILISSPCIL